MSTIVYQELQCIESSTTLNLKLYTPKTNTNSTTTSSSCSWSEIEELSNKKDEKKQAVYVHPLLKNSSFKLSDKSLEMCTESLGNESGSCFFFPPFLSSSSSSSSSTSMNSPQKKKQLSLLTNQANFPPPLTTISGSNPIHFRHYRQEGRLVIEAVPSPPTRSYMQAERSNGRLKLSLLVDNYNYSHINEDVDEVYSSCDEQEDNNHVCRIQTMENEVVFLENEHTRENYNNKMEEEEDVIKQVLERNINIIGDYDAAFMLQNKNSVKGIKLELGKLQRPRRCKEGSQGNKRLINWEPFWVAT